MNSEAASLVSVQSRAIEHRCWDFCESVGITCRVIIFLALSLSPLLTFENCIQESSYNSVSQLSLLFTLDQGCSMAWRTLICQAV